MLRAPRQLRSFLRAPVSGTIPEEVRGGIAIGLAVVAVLALGATSRTLLEADRAQAVAERAAVAAVVKTSGAYVPTSDDWLDQLTNPSAWRSGRFKVRQRGLTRQEELEARREEERIEREERQRAEREAREEAWETARELGRERGT